MDKQSLSHFANTCGLAEPFALQVYRDGKLIEVFGNLTKPFVLIGRSTAADVVLNHPQVSKRHTYLQIINGSCFFVNLYARSSETTNSENRASGWIRNGDFLQIGPYAVRLVAKESSNNFAGFDPLAAATQPTQETVYLEFLNSAGRKTGSRFWEMNRLLALAGCSRRCKVRFSDPSVSAFHCSLINTGQGLWILDLLGRDGIAVNRQQVAFTLIQDGDVLQIGKFNVRVHFRAPQDSDETSHWIGTSSIDNFNDSHDGLQHHSNESSTPPENSLDQVASVFFTKSSQVPARTGTHLVHDPSNLHPSSCQLVQSEGINSVLFPLLDHFSTMQQQMFQQFQQTIITLAQTFRELHEDQAELVRAELRQLQQINKELFALQAEKAKDRTKGDIPAASTGESRIDQPPMNAAEHESNAGNSNTTEGSDVTEERTARPKANETTRKFTPNGKSPPEPPNGLPEKEVHNWISNRMQSLEKERQNSWQRLLGFLSGK